MQFVNATPASALRGPQMVGKRRAISLPTRQPESRLRVLDQLCAESLIKRADSSSASVI